MNKEIVATMARLHDAVKDLEVLANNLNDVMDRRNAQERIRIIRTILDQMNKKLEAQIMEARMT